MKIGQLDLKNIVVTDFETFYDSTYTLRKMRQEEYILDRRFKVHGIGVAYANGKTDFIDPEDIAKWLKAHRKHTIVNHKLDFDGLIWKLRYNHVAPFMVDTRFLANAVFGPAEVSGGNDLESVAERLGFQAKGKIEMFKGVYDLSPEEYKAMRVYATNDADLTFKALHALLPRLSRPEFELWLIDHTLRIYIDKPLPVIPKRCYAAIRLVEDKVQSLVKAIPPLEFTYTRVKKLKRKAGTVSQVVQAVKKVDDTVLASNDQFGQLLVEQLKKHKIPVPLKHGKNGMIPALAKADEGLMALAHSPVKAVSALVSARLAKRSGDTQIARLRTLLKCAKSGGFRVYLNYHGASTGRWSGGSGLNAHNFPNPTRSPVEFERFVAAAIRACVVPPAGKVFVATDAANIEARVTAWWAGQQDLVNAFGEGTDVYSQFAAETFKEEVRKPKPDDSKAKATRFKLLRNVGKSTILGLGYGMGNRRDTDTPVGKFEKNLRSSPDVRALFDSGDLTTAKCDDIIAQYRQKYDKIVSLWGRVQNAFMKAREGGKRMVGGVLFSRSKGSVDVTLPSGRVIHYPNVRLGQHEEKSKDHWVYGHGNGRKIYGGLLVENIVQAISRDILAEAVLLMEQSGYEVAYHVHDAVVNCVPEAKAKACLARAVEVLSETPTWGHGMRLGAEGAIEKVFA